MSEALGVLAALIKAQRRDALKAQLWMSVIQQRKYWVPREVFEDYCNASVQVVRYQEVLGPHVGSDIFVKPTFDVDGVIRVRDMEPRYRANVIAFLHRKAERICHGMACQDTLYGGIPMGEAATDAFESESMEWLDRAVMPGAAARWLNEQPLLKALAKPRKK